MKYSKKSKLLVIISVIMFLSAVAGAVALGAGVGIESDEPPKIYISAEDLKIKEALTDANSWGNDQSDYPHPIDFKYGSNNIVDVGANERMIISTQKLKLDKKYNFSLVKVSVYKNRQPLEPKAPEPSILNGNLYLHAPPDSGEYIYYVTLKYGSKGTVSYGFVVRVDMLSFDLAEISKYRTPYIGDASKVSVVARNLPVPDRHFNQRYISLETDKKPYELNVFYEVKNGNLGSEWADVISGNEMNSKLVKNALVLFCMIDNLDVVNFAFRNSKSDGKLDTSKYEIPFSFKRTSFKKKYGDLSALGKDLNLLQKALEDGKPTANNIDFTDAEIESARNVVYEYFRAIREKDDKAILKTLTAEHNHPKVVLYGDEIRTLLTVDYNPDDPMRDSYLKYGRGFSNNSRRENVIVFKVSFNVKYPIGKSGSFNEGDYKNWSVILIREGKESPWLIDGQGI